MAARSQCWIVAIGIALAASLSAGTAQAQGIFMPGVGPINQSFGGVATAAPIDAAGALHWNPASISGMASNEIVTAFGVVLPNTTVSSTVPAGAFGPLGPPVTLSGSTQSTPGATPVPTGAMVYRPEGSRFTYGIGMFGIGGFSANYPASFTNPILTPQPPNGLGLGRIYSQAQIYQIVPTASYAVTDRFSLGFAPTVSLAQVSADPFFFAPPNDANGNGFPTYGPGTGTHVAWGAGFQVGAYYVANDWNFGMSFKSPQWFEPFRYNSQNELGQPINYKTNFYVPMVVSWGTAYTGFDRWLFAADIRYFDYGGTEGFKHSGFNADGSVAGLGWNSNFSIGTGAQFQATRRLTMRMGYIFTKNPIPNSQSEFNIPAALIIENWLTMGATFRITNNIAASFAYMHGFQNSITGPYQTVLGAVPGTSITNTVSADILNSGLTVYF